MQNPNLPNYGVQGDTPIISTIFISFFEHGKNQTGSKLSLPISVYRAGRWSFSAMAKPTGFKTSAEIRTRTETLRGPHSPEVGTMYMPSSMLPEKVFRSEVTNKKRGQQQKKLH